MRNTIAILLAAILTFAANTSTVPGKVEFEARPRAVAKGRNPKLIARRAHGLMMLYSSGADLYYQSSNDVGDTFSPPARVNHVPGEVSDHGENSPQLLASPDDTVLYAVWNGRDPQNPQGSHIRVAAASAMMTKWMPAVTVDDDGQPISHGFQGAAVGPDGTLWVAWLDARDGLERNREGVTGGTTSLYLSYSQDGGKTFAKNIRVAKGVCPCCRPSFGFAKNAVVVTWRGTEAGDMRDVMYARTENRGQTWSEPKLVARDGWKIKGCPHVGPNVTSLDGQIAVSWYSEGGSKPAIYVAESGDAGQTFRPKRLLSEGTHDPTHPLITAGEDRLGVVFQARDASRDQGWGKVGVYYRELLSGSRVSPLMRLEGAGSVNYPSAALGLSGRVFVAWTETRDEGPVVVLARGRR